jgi:hypothetical protein
MPASLCTERDPLILGFSDFHHSTIRSTAVSANTP